jgi:hypothetical protein
MPVRNARPTIFRPRTLSDAVDSTNGPAGAMQVLQNLIPAPFNRQIMVPRPAATLLTSFPGFTSPAYVEAEYSVGNIVYGWVASGRFSGHSEPYAYNKLTNAFLTITGVTAANTPVSTSTAGNWTPPVVQQVGSRVMMTHPGYTGAPNNAVMGWLDLTGFSSSALTGNTNSNMIINGLSSNPLTAGVAPGMLISDSAGDIPAGTFVVSLTATQIQISANATGSHTGTTLTITGGTSTSPLFAAGNMNGNPLPSVPVSVASFNGRAYYAVGDTLQFSDAGDPLQDSNNPNIQVINFQNGLNVTALSTYPNTNVLGGVAEALIAFQGSGAIQQVTGDPTTSNLAANVLFYGTGTLSPNSVSTTPQGIYFISPDGLRLIGLQGTVTPALGTQGDGVALPFINAQFQTRTAGSWNSDTYRVAVQTSATASAIWDQFLWGHELWGAGEVVTQEYWFNTKLGIWTGPHTFPSTLIEADTSSGSFIISSISLGASLWQSNAIGQASDTYIENSINLSCSALSCLLPDNEQMAMNSLGSASTMIGFASSGGMMVTVSFYRENGQQLDNVNVPVTGAGETIWGAFIWGAANWGAVASKYSQYVVQWNQPLVFKQGQIGVSFPAGVGNLLGNFYMRIEPLGYPILGASDGT